MYELAVGGGIPAKYFVFFLTVGLAGLVGLWLRKLIDSKGVPTTASELGRRWAAWTSFITCTASLSEFFGKLDGVSLFKSVVGAVILTVIAYALGWAYGKFFKFKNGDGHSAATTEPINTGNQALRLTQATSSVDDDAIYASIAKEFESGAIEQGLWTRLFAECDGDERRTKVAYIKQRVEQITTKTATSRIEEDLVERGPLAGSNGETEESVESETTEKSTVIEPRRPKRSFLAYLLVLIIGFIAGMIFSFALLSNMVINQAQKIGDQRDEISQLDKQYSRCLNRLTEMEAQCSHKESGVK